MRNRIAFASFILLAALACAAFARRAQQGPPPILGRWDLTVTTGGESWPSWLEVEQSGRSLVGRFVGRFGSVRPVGHVVWSGGGFHFSLPPQFEDRKTDLEFEGTVADGKLTGTTVDEKGRSCTVTGVHAPDLVHTEKVHWGRPIALFNGHDLEGWKGLHSSSYGGWVVRDGILNNAKAGTNLVSDQKFTDFKIHAEFRVPKGGNSGIYLRGRYEAQIEDDFGRPPNAHGLGGIYGFVKPRINAGKAPGEWQTYDITLVGREVTIVLNGEEVVTRQEIAGPTGGAIDSDEGAPGPIYLQGDHTTVEFRKVVVTPAE